MSMFGRPAYELSAEHQRAENAQAGFKLVMEEYRDHSLALHDPAELVALTAQWSFVGEIVEHARVQRLALQQEAKQVETDWYRNHPKSLEALNVLSAALEARTMELSIAKRVENRVAIAASSSLDDPAQRLEARQWALEAYFLTFPDRLPTPAGPKGNFSLTARVLEREIQSSDFTFHESPEAAKLHAEAISVARGAPLEPWDAWTHPGGELVYRTMDESECSYRISKDPDRSKGPTISSQVAPEPDYV